MRLKSLKVGDAVYESGEGNDVRYIGPNPGDRPNETNDRFLFQFFREHLDVVQMYAF